MPWVGTTLSTVFISQDGAWEINRNGYADRMSRYVISPTGRLTRFADTSGSYLDKDVSGVEHGGSKMMKSRNYVDVKLRPMSPYIAWRKALRATEDYPDAISADGNTSFTESADRFIAGYNDYVLVCTFGVPPYELHEVLQGHHYFPVFDSWAYIDPYLWITTDRVSHLSRIYVSDREGEMRVAEDVSVPIDLGVPIERDCTVGIDPLNHQLFIVLATGDRFWFDPDTLGRLDRDMLPGCWAPEYASLGNMRPGYNFDLGWPLTQRGYERLMRVLMLVFLLSLLYLAVQWRQAWRYIAGATTVDSSLNDRSSNT